jgi:hypothetical protein
MFRLRDLFSFVFGDGRKREGKPSQAGVSRPSAMRLEDDGELTSWFRQSGCCPDCGGAEFVPGPRGGLAQNMKCSGCGSEYNIARYEGRIITVDRIYRDKHRSDVVVVTTRPERAARLVH